MWLASVVLVFTESGIYRLTLQTWYIVVAGVDAGRKTVMHQE